MTMRILGRSSPSWLRRAAGDRLRDRASTMLYASAADRGRRGHPSVSRQTRRVASACIIRISRAWLEGTIGPFCVGLIDRKKGRNRAIEQWRVAGTPGQPCHHLDLQAFATREHCGFVGRSDLLKQVFEGGADSITSHRLIRKIPNVSIRYSSSAYPTSGTPKRPHEYC
jgi:hypothetical protein